MERDELIEFFIEHGRRWVASERDVHRPDARALSASERTELARFFDGETLDRARVKAVRNIERPAFTSHLRDVGQADLLDFRRMAGITFIDTILVSRMHVPLRSELLPLLFHEMVHVVQYEILGLDALMEQYVRGWAENGFNYFAIPLERDAYELQEQYEVNRGVCFSVTAAVRERLDDF